MTELEAVNISLQTIGEMTLTTGNNISDVYEANSSLEVLREVRRSVLTEGLNCNTDTDWDLTADSTGGEPNTGYIAIAPNMLRLESNEGNYIMRDNLLYNKDERTFLWEAQSNHKVDAVWDLDFDDLPHTLAYYIAIKSARIVYQRLIGSTDIIRVLMDDEAKAQQKMIDHDVATNDYNIFDGAANSRIISRNKNPRGIRG